ncbi:MAG: DUF4173 domain-containing protein [Bacteroidota bacterium]
MKSASLKTSLVLAGAVLFNIVFWQEKLAVNTALFDGFILAAVFYLYQPSFKKPAMKWLLLAHLITVVTLIIHNTVLSKLAFTGTLMLVIVFTQYEHRSLWYAGASAFMNYVLMVPGFVLNIGQLKKGKHDFYNTKKILRFIIIPIIILVVFAVLYSFSNAVFHDILNTVGLALENFFSRFFDWFSWARFAFLLFGVFITGGLLLKSKADFFSRSDIQKQDKLDRKKNDLKKWKQTPMFDMLSLLMGKFANGVLALRNENTVGIISLVLLNLLLFFINWIDVVYVWFGFKYSSDINLSQYVHEGAGLLIFSIILAMLVLLFFFRGNLNFYKKNKWLKVGAYVWIMQNIILVVSVFFRDYYYIHEFGLAYKRIGVLVFLTLVLAGLLTVYIKISQVKTTYFLLKVNAWVVMVVLVLSSCIHWDETIAEYNLSRKSTLPLDVKFLLSLSDKALPVLEKNQDVLDKSLINVPQNDEGDSYYRSGLTAKKYFEIRKKTFFEEQENYTWLSWNAADSYVKKHLQKPAAAISFSHK